MNKNSFGLDKEPRAIYGGNERHPFIKCAGVVLLSFVLLSSGYASSGYQFPYAGQLVQYELVADYSVQQITQTLAEAYSSTGEDMSALMRSATAVKAYAVEYYTPYVNGQLVIASGLVSIPSPSSGSYPILSYMHGTALKNDEVPSYPDKCSEAQLMVMSRSLLK